MRGGGGNTRYRIVKLLGDGTFGRVLLAEDLMDRNRQVAVKVIRDVKRCPNAPGISSLSGSSSPAQRMAEETLVCSGRRILP